MEDYSIKDIQSLSFRDAVRKRINMYLGSDDNEGTYQALKEIINNSTDEAIAGFGKQISICVSERENTVSVSDRGRGVPFGVRDNGENVLVAIFSKSHTGGKFTEDVYKNVSGLNGIGAKCACLSSLYFTVKSFRDGKCAEASFKKGELVGYKEISPYSAPTGTYIQFTPDPEVFHNGTIGFNYDRICNDMHNISYLYTGITFTIENLDTSVVKSYCSTNGITDFVKDNVNQKLIPHIITASIKDGTDKMEIAYTWGAKTEQSYVFVNGLLCPEGGSPITGAKTAITRTFNSLTKKTFDGDSIRQNMFYVINCSVANPSFANQTKSKINNSNLRTMASTCFSDSLKDMKLRYSTDFETLETMLEKVAKAEAAADKARKQILEATKDIEKAQKQKVFASDKLKDAEFLGQGSTLLLVEGLSAASSIAMSRDETKYGILALRGKMLNLFTADDEDVYKNEEIKLLLSAMNIVPQKYNASKLRYGRIGILTDADADGYSIGLLIMCALYTLAPQFVQEGRLCWVRSPLYIVKNGGKESYYYTDEEFNTVRKTIRGEVQRAKGLGALSPEQAHRSMFLPEFQKIDTLIPDEETLPLLSSLMGKDSQPKHDFIFNNIDFSEIKE